MKRPRTGTRWAARGTALGAIVLTAVFGAGAATADPAPKTSPIAALVNQIADVDQSLANLAADVSGKQENVNRTLVDFQSAVAAQQLAAAADQSAKSSLTKVNKQVEAAQRDFNAFMRTVNRQGNNMGAMSKYVASDDPGQVLDQMTAVDQVSRQQQATIRKLQVARNQQANRVAATSATKAQTQAAAEGAADRRAAAISAVNAARTAMAQQKGKRTELMNKRSALAAQLAKLKKSDTKVDANVPDLGSIINGVPKNNADGDDALAQAAQAAAKLAVDVAQQALAKLLGDNQIPHSQLLDELGIGGAAPLDSVTKLGTGSLSGLLGGSGGNNPGITRPGVRGPEAVEIVVNRAKSQLGLPYAWGGGDANGPTLGIRDGGVADSHGDYNKIGFDCSGLMVYAFAGIGYSLPHYTGYQYTSGPQFPLSEMQRGDMIFYGPNASEHVAMYLGDNQMIEAPQSGDVVKISPLRTDGAMPMVVRLT
ncbi:MAG: NlpC/P60 family protein [Gordonia sp. (in: high G+C Gram-positive bacteria)]